MLTVFSLSVYFTLVQTINNIEIQNILDYRLIQNNLINFLIINIAIISDKLSRLGYSKKDALEILLKIGAIQGVICVVSIFFLPLKDIAVQLYANTGGINEFVIGSRVFGISNDYTFGTPIYHGMLAGIGLYYAIKNKVNYYPYIALILFASIMNGRTGILVFIIFYLGIIVHNLLIGNLKYAKKPLLAILLVSVLMVGAIQYVAPSSYNFISILVQDTNNLIFKKELTGNYEALNQSISLPSGNALIYGAGHRVYADKASEYETTSSDIGFINDLYMIGIVLSIVFYITILYFLRYRSTEDKFLMTALFIILMFANIKGEVFRSSIVMFLVIYTKIILDSKYTDKIHE